MTLREELEQLKTQGYLATIDQTERMAAALLAVLNMHGVAFPDSKWCNACDETAPCSTVEVIAREMREGVEL